MSSDINTNLTALAIVPSSASVSPTSVDLAPRSANTCPELSSELASVSSMPCAICSSDRSALGGCNAGHLYLVDARACMLDHGVVDEALAGMDDDASSMGHHG